MPIVALCGAPRVPERLDETLNAAVNGRSFKMQDGAVMFKVLDPMRDGPIVQIGPGDLAQPYGRSLWTRFTGFLTAIVETMREARSLERRLIGQRGCHGIRES